MATGKTSAVQQTADERFGAEYDAQNDLYVGMGISRDQFIKTAKIEAGIDQMPTPGTQVKDLSVDETNNWLASKLRTSLDQQIPPQPASV